GLRGGAHHLGIYGQGGSAPAGQCANGPDAGRTVVTAGAGCGAHEAETGRDWVVEGHARGRVRAVVGHDNDEGDHIAYIGPRVADSLADGQVGLLRRLDGAGAIVRGVGVELVAVTDRSRIGPGDRADHARLDGQRLWSSGRHRAHGPGAGGAVVGPL